MKDMKLSIAIYHSTIWGQEDYFFKKLIILLSKDVLN